MLCPPAILGLAFLATSSVAQDAAIRYELGQRVRGMEEAWDRHAEPAARRRAVPLVDAATKGFFVLDFAGVARNLDLARHALAEEGEPRLDWFDALTFRLERRLLAPGAAPLELGLGVIYEGPAVPHFTLRATPLAGDRSPLGEPVAWEVDDLPWSQAIDLGGLPEGDHQLLVELASEGTVVSGRTLGFSVVARLPERLAALDRALLGEEEDADPSEILARDSGTYQLELLRRLAAGEALETELPAARMLRQAEAALTPASAEEGGRAGLEAGQYWFAFRAGARPWRARVLVPRAAVDGEPVPLVLALHGMGGSENLFFDGYGRGAIVRLCEERGWLLVAPRMAMFGNGSLDALVGGIASVLPVDRRRVLLVGHSMGAAVGLAAVQDSPRTWAAFAALGGGRGARGAEQLVDLPIFVGAGALDFGLTGARLLHTSLQRAGARKAILRVYPDTEHLTVVQVALPDVFRFFDEVLNQE